MNTEQALRSEIKEQLSKVNKNNAPKINERIKTQVGYQEIETRIVAMVIKDGITPSACVPQIEIEL